MCVGGGGCQTWTIPLWLIFVCIVLMEFAFHFATHTHTHRSTRTLAISLNTLTPNALFRYVYIYLFTYTFVLLFLVSSYVFTKINGMESSLGQATRQTQSWKWSKLVFTWFLFGKRFSLKIFLVYLLSAKVRHCPLMGLYICMSVCVYNVKLLYMGLRMEIVLH